MVHLPEWLQENNETTGAAIKKERSLMSKASDRDVETLPLRVALHREQSGREIERNESIRRTKP